MPELMLVPEVAAGATEMILMEWLAPVGSLVRSGDAIAIVETAKAVVEVEAEADGTLLKTLVSPGTTVSVGIPMAVIGDSADAESDVEQLLASLGVAPSAGETSAPAASTAEPSPPAITTQASPKGDSSRVFVSPIARKLLREAGLDTDGIAGTGPNGRIRRRDVEAALAAASTAPRPSASVAATVSPAPEPSSVRPPQDTDAWTDIPHTRLRRAIATRLTASKQETPHFYLKRSAALDDLVALRAQVNAVSDQRVSINDFLIRAIAVAHAAVPAANAIWTPEAIRQFRTVDVSVAIASERGLVTPVLRDVGRSSVSSIAGQVRAYVEQANAGRLQQRDLEGGSITISNLGMYGVEEFAAIINPPQSAILAVGAARSMPRVVKDRVKVRSTVDLVLSVDHRAIDGALAAQWMHAFVTAVENPLSLLV